MAEGLFNSPSHQQKKVLFLSYLQAKKVLKQLFENLIEIFRKSIKKFKKQHLLSNICS